MLKKLLKGGIRERLREHNFKKTNIEENTVSKGIRMQAKKDKKRE